MSNFQEARVSSIISVASFTLLSPSFMVYGDDKHLFRVPSLCSSSYRSNILITGKEIYFCLTSLSLCMQPLAASILLSEFFHLIIVRSQD